MNQPKPTSEPSSHKATQLEIWGPAYSLCRTQTRVAFLLLSSVYQPKSPKKNASCPPAASASRAHFLQSPERWFRLPQARTTAPWQCPRTDRGSRIAKLGLSGRTQRFWRQKDALQGDSGLDQDGCIRNSHCSRLRLLQKPARPGLAFAGRTGFDPKGKNNTSTECTHSR